MIHLKDIQFRYAHSDFSLEVDALSFEQQSKTAVIGPSGFGKTTLLNLIAGILLPATGTVTVDKMVVNKLADSERRNFRIGKIGFVFQDFRLVPYLNVLDNILLPFRINAVLKPTPETLSKARQLAGELRIEKLIRKYPARLSHGERQRVAIARALVGNSKIILADEPTGNLDPANKQHIKNILFDTAEQHQATLITVTHDHEMLEGFDRIIDFKDLNTEPGK